VVPSGTPSAGAPLSLQLWSYFEDGQSLLTLSGEKFAWIGDSPALRIVDGFRVTWEEQLRDHMAEHARHPRSALALGLEELVARANADAETLIERLQPTQDPNATTFHRLSWRRVLHLTMQFVRYAGAFNQLQAKRSQLAAWPAPEAAQLWVAARAYRLVDVVQTSCPPRRSLVWTTFGVTGVLFAISMVAYGSFGFIAQLVLVLLVHELGHWLAMRLSGYRDPAIFFIPFFGAAATGQKADASFRQELTVLVAGPLPGLLLGVGLLWSDLNLPAWAVDLARTAVWVNGVNLFPIWPLDGGRVLHRLLFRDRPWLEATFSLLSAALFAVLALATSDPILFLLPVALVSAGLSGLRVARHAQRARALAAQGLTDPLQQALRVASETPNTFAHKVMVVRRVLARMQAPESTRGQVVLGSIGYSALVVMTVLALGLTAGASEREQSVECTQLAQLPAALQTADRFVCQEGEATPADLWADLSAFSALPPELCLRAPWHAEPALSEEQLRARKTVSNLLALGRGAGPDPVSIGDEREHELRAWTLHRVERVLDKARQEPDFDPSAADALLAHLRSDEDDGPAKHALEAQLGAAECAALTFVSVGTEQHPYQAGFVADPAQLAAHLCAAGCQRLTLVTYE
jgi:Zn-dependent protease